MRRAMTKWGVNDSAFPAILYLTPPFFCSPTRSHIAHLPRHGEIQTHRNKYLAKQLQQQVKCTLQLNY